jgi:hypothetical protein
MTSWSLTILFIHLWLTALICLYFYSIDQRTRLYALFSYLFGPFSCARAEKRQIIKNNTTNSVATTGAQILNHTPPKSNSSSTLVSKLDSMYFDKNTNSLTPSLNNYLNNKNNDYNNNDNDISGDIIETATKDSQLNSTKLLLIENTNDLDLVVKKTYCDKKHKCALHSATVGNDSYLWQKWIESHVPSSILILIKLSWLLYTLVMQSALMVTIGYFTYVTYAELEVEDSLSGEIGNLHRHGFNSVVAIIDLVLLAYPVRILHFVYTSAYGWAYAIVTFFYWIQNPKLNIVYEQVDYGKPLTIAFYYLMLTLLTFIMQIMHFFAYQFKLYLREKYLSVKLKCVSNNNNSNIN